jgi:N-acetylglucosaminyl-diphospho-decaprenol L-rhamnosyltransferase
VTVRGPAHVDEPATADEGTGDVAPVAPDLAVVIVNYNAGHYLRRALRSTFESAGDALLEVVVVDNASEDSSGQAVASYPEVTLIQNERNVGFATAVNQGIRATTAPFVLLLNPDAEILSGTLAGFLKLARDHPRAGAIGPLVRDPDGGIYPSARKIPSVVEGLVHSFLGPFRPDNRYSRAYTMADWDHHSERPVEWVSGSCMLLRREALDQVGLMDQAYFFAVEDVDLCTRLRMAGWEVLFSPELEVLHQVGISRGRSKWITLEHSKSIYRYFVKFESPGWRAALRPFVWLALRARATLVSWRRGEH